MRARENANFRYKVDENNGRRLLFEEAKDLVGFFSATRDDGQKGVLPERELPPAADLAVVAPTQLPA
ncbi:MAG: hypothetical protein U5K69_04660 [Balneolaceae bacterium]|nr:hypothetical protein [Balneolaceae bacterium]